MSEPVAHAGGGPAPFDLWLLHGNVRAPPGHADAFPPIQLTQEIAIFLLCWAESGQAHHVGSMSSACADSTLFAI